MGERAKLPWTWSRRELLTAFLGAPLAALSCRTADQPSLPPGELVGPSVDVGHRIRDGYRPEPSADAWRDVSVVIVGAGVSGLGAAWRLARSGARDFVVLDLEPVAGGTSRGGASSVVAYPWGAHYVPAPLREDRAVVALLDEMGVLDGADARGNPIVAEQYLCRDPEERIYHLGRWSEGLYLRAGASDEDLRQFEAFRAETQRWASWRDARGRRAFSIPVAASSDDPEVRALDRITMSEWLSRHGFTSERLRWFVEYACRDDYGGLLDQTSAWAGLFYFCSRVGELGDEAQPLVTWPEGNGRLVAHLAASAGERLALGHAVVDVRPVEAAARALEVVAFDVASDRPVGFRCDRVIMAAPRYLVPRIVAPLRDAPPAYAGEFVYGSWMVANLHLSDRPETRPRDFPICWDNVLYDSPSLGYVVATHQTELDRGPTVFTYYYPVCDADPKAARGRMLAAGRDEWADIALSDLAVPHREIRDVTERLDVMRWGHAMIRPVPGFIWGEARRKAAEPFRNVHFAHTDLSGVALFEEAFYHGIRAAEEVLATRPGGPVESLIGMSIAVAVRAHSEAADSRWLFSRGVDLTVFLGSALLSLALLAIGARAGVLDDATPDWAWIPCVLLVDVAHVYSTFFRVYLDVDELKRRPTLYTLVPVLGFVFAALVYGVGRLLFWQVLAYLAVFHFVRQQYGWVALYRGRCHEFDRKGHILDAAAVYAATLYPLAYWHAHLPRRFWWFLEGDFWIHLPAALVGALRARLLVAACDLCRKVGSCVATGAGQSREGRRRRDDGRLLVRRDRRLQLRLRVHGDERRRAWRAVSGARVLRLAPARGGSARLGAGAVLRARDRPVPDDVVDPRLLRGDGLGPRDLAGPFVVLRAVVGRRHARVSPRTAARGAADHALRARRIHLEASGAHVRNARSTSLRL